MVRLATDNDFNIDGRNQIHMKIDIYFDGDGAPPVSITKDDYLLVAEILEESGAESEWPLGSVSANELTFTLYSDKGRFNPANKDGPYYGKIKKKVKIIPYFKPDDTEIEEWIKMGVFYVSDWQAAVTGITANVTAHDKIKDVLNDKQIELPVVKGTTYKAFYEAIFDYLELPHSISEDLNTPLPWSFIDDEENGVTLQTLASSTFSICLSDRDGNMTARAVKAAQPLRATLTDDNQVKTSQAMLSLIKAYTGVSIDYNMPQVSADEEILEVKDVDIPPNIKTHDAFKFKDGAVYMVTAVRVKADKQVLVTNYSCKTNSIVVTTANPTKDTLKGTITIYGIKLNKISMTIADEEDEEEFGNLLEIDNVYIQSAEHAARHKRILNSFIASDVPELFNRIRGNPLLQIGERIKVISEMYSLNYDGIIIRAKYRYDGALSCELTVLDTSIFGGA